MRPNAGTPVLPWRPMEPVLWPAPFDDPDWRFQPKWDGIRGLAVVADGRARIFGRHGGERTGRYHEIVAALPQAVGGRDCRLDGEIMALVDGRPSFSRVMQRAMSHDAQIPVYYAVFDLVGLDGQDLRPQPWERRQELLQGLLRPGGQILPTPAYAGSGTALFAAVKARRLEGIVGKRADSPYLGGASGLWRKVKVRRRQLCVITGYTERAGRLRSLLIGAYDGRGRLVDLGGVGSGLTEADLVRLGGLLSREPAVSPPYRPAPRGREVSLRFVPPLHVVEVEYAERGSDGRLRAPVVVGFPRGTPAAAILAEP